MTKNGWRSEKKEVLKSAPALVLNCCDPAKARTCVQGRKKIKTPTLPFSSWGKIEHRRADAIQKKGTPVSKCEKAGPKAPVSAGLYSGPPGRRGEDMVKEG